MTVVAVGSSGDYAIGSSMKFFPIYEGGAWCRARHALDTHLQSAGLGFEAKAALTALETSFSYGRLPALRVLLALPLRARTLLWNAMKAARRRPARWVQPPRPAWRRRRRTAVSASIRAGSTNAHRGFRG